MREYVGLIKQLRECASRRDCLDCQYGNDTLFCFEPRITEAADAIEELMTELDKAVKRMCEFCGVCSEKSRSPFECEIAGFASAPPKEDAE